MKYLIRVAALLVGMMALGAGQASAQITNLGPPTAGSPGQEILDLAGTYATIQMYNPNGTCAGSVQYSASGPTQIANCDPVQETATFTTPDDISTATLTFAFRNDPGYFGFSNVSLTTGGGSNLLTDGNFANASQVLNSQSSQANITASACSGYAWCGYNQVPGIASGSLVPDDEPAYPGSSGLQLSGNGNFWVDGATGQYDGIYQTLTLQSDTTYTLTFDLQNITSNNSAFTSGGSIFDGCSGVADYTQYSDTATNVAAVEADSLPSECTNGVDVLAYVGYPDLPTPTGGFGTLAQGAPEPASVVLLGTGLLGLGVLRRFRAG